MSLNILGDKKIAEDANDVVENGLEIAFIPKGVSNPEDYKGYRVRLVKSVPINCALVCENIFTGKVKAFGSGFKIIAPWYRSKLVLVGDTQIDYPTHKYLSQDGIQMAVDYTLNLRIVDPIKYSFENQDTLLALNQLTEDLMRVFVHNHNSDVLFGKRFSINDIDPTGEYKKFASKYGLLCFGVLFKCDIPKSLKDGYAKQKMQERENERKRLEAEAELALARINAQIKVIVAEAEAKATKILGSAKAEVFASKLKLLLESLRDFGLNEVDLATVRSYLLADSSKANVFATFGDGDIANLSAAIAAGVQSGQKKNGSLPERGTQVVQTQQEQPQQEQQRGQSDGPYKRRR